VSLAPEFNSAKTLRVTPRGFSHWCPGCECLHEFVVRDVRLGDPVWKMVGTEGAPAFDKPMLVLTRAPGSDRVVGRCHYYVQHGAIRYLRDCTHGLANRIVPLPKLPPSVLSGHEF
jgi:hypothetical protein